MANAVQEGRQGVDAEAAEGEAVEAAVAEAGAEE